MKKSKITIVPATSEHSREFYGEQCTKSFKGYAALLDGKVVGVGGLSFENETMMLFSDMKEELRPFKEDIWRAIGLLRDLVKKADYPIVAIASNKENASQRLLIKLGFASSGQSTPDGKIFRRFP